MTDEDLGKKYRPQIDKAVNKFIDGGMHVKEIEAEVTKLLNEAFAEAGITPEPFHVEVQGVGLLVHFPDKAAMS